MAIQAMEDPRRRRQSFEPVDRRWRSIVPVSLSILDASQSHPHGDPDQRERLPARALALTATPATAALATERCSKPETVTAMATDTLGDTSHISPIVYSYSVRKLTPTSQTVLISAVLDAASERPAAISPGETHCDLRRRGMGFPGPFGRLVAANSDRLGVHAGTATRLVPQCRSTEFRRPFIMPLQRW